MHNVCKYINVEAAKPLQGPSVQRDPNSILQYVSLHVENI